MTAPTLFDAPSGAAIREDSSFPTGYTRTIELGPDGVERLGPTRGGPRPASDEWEGRAHRVDVQRILALVRPTGDKPGWVRDELSEAWWDFHLRHPDVNRSLVRLAYQGVERGALRLGVGMLWEVLRWETMLGADVPHEEPFKLNNNYRAYYARFIMETEEGLAGIFLTREVRADRDR